MPRISCRRFDPAVLGSQPVSLDTNELRYYTAALRIRLSGIFSLFNQRAGFATGQVVTHLTWYVGNPHLLCTVSILNRFSFFTCFSLLLNKGSIHTVGCFLKVQYGFTICIHSTRLVSQGEGWPAITKYDVGMILVRGWKERGVTRHYMNHQHCHMAAYTPPPLDTWRVQDIPLPLFWQGGKTVRALEALPGLSPPA